MFKRFVVLTVAVTTGLATLLVAGPAGASRPHRSAPSLVSVPGGFAALAPSRLLDTRAGLGAAKAAVASGATVALQVAGRGGVPASAVSAVVLNVTVTAPHASGFVTVYGDGATRPTVSNLNFVAAQTVPNLVIAPVGANGKVALYNGSPGTIELVADVSGYYLSGTPAQAGAFGSLSPTRLLDTRSGLGAAKAAAASGATVALQVAGRGGVPASGVSAVVLNVTVVAPAASGFVTVFGNGTTRPGVSNLNFVKAQTVPNLVVAPVGANGKVDLYNGSPGSVQLVADVSGYYRAGAPVQAGAFGSLSAPSRVLDTRAGTGAAKAAVPAGGTVALQLAGRGGVPASGVSAVVLNVTVTAPAASGFVTAFGYGTTRPTVSNLNFVKAQTVPNLVIAPVGANGKVALYNGSPGSVELIADVSGYYRAAASPPATLTGVTATTTNASITLKWVNPAGSSSTGVMIRRSVGSTVPSSPTSGSFVADVATPTATFTNTGLDSGTKYTYALFAHDAAPVYGAGATTSATTTTTTGYPSIQGTVTDEGGAHAGLDDVRVDVISLSSGDGFSTSTLDNGTWAVTGLPAGSYSVCFNAGNASGGSSDGPGYVNECHLNKPTSQSATPVIVTTDATRSGVDAALAHAATYATR